MIVILFHFQCLHFILRDVSPALGLTSLEQWVAHFTVVLLPYLDQFSQALGLGGG
jgi:hypothetical protein